MLWADGTFNLARYAAAVVSALPVTAEYAVSNVIFLLILANPIGEKLERMKKNTDCLCRLSAGKAPTSFGDVMPGERIDG